MIDSPNEPPRLANAAERRTWEALVDQAQPDDLVVPGQRVTDHLKDHEVDFVVGLEGAGIVCLEVKGGEVWHDGDGWRQTRGGRQCAIEPVRQAREACYALRDFVEKDPRWTQGRLRWDHVVVLPNTELPADFGLPECPRWKVIDRNDLPNLVDLLREVLLKQELDRPLLTGDGVEQLRVALSGRGLPQRDVVARALANEDAADTLTEQQAVILNAARLLNRIEVRGGAGSGKTFLAMEQARRLAQDGQRVALVCYSHGLASYLERVTATWPRRQQPAYVGEFHALGVQWGAPEGPDEALRTEQTVQFWEHDLPSQMTELAAQLEPGHRFDAVVVDEAQDFADAWWDPLLGALRDPVESGLYVFSDEGQRVFNRYGSPPVPLVPLILDHNVRNTRQIANAFQPLVDHPMRFLGGDGPQVTFVACDRDDALGVGDDQVDSLLDAGWRPEDIALLTTGSRHPEQVERQRDGNTAYWDTFWDTDQVFYGHVLGFKGLERRCVVLVINEQNKFDRSRERLYVGLSRARDQLVVCGDPEFICDVGGADLARRLGI
ncbi:ATP-binding domain-containing protein [Mycolicibacterium smegmatis]|uniref:ATP-binding domain-containing protein n=1 Tax=Mycolicibacterium smegmatis TaxID=1772 RepID=UPI0005D84D12|nr:ATP-binding domain-containing protein [Mycolicibacterium smegmatis]MDF1902978.1 ATP-binding domain-containing protein [Mycolicibacterium smegmatis]MDF1909254.1 ATP-binding domain-containing protein [Mycolicibacterium smegmatis]MDF1921433.1 ATP-binding domain-containing protein [Mycolicibacterium smegmatis]MDF1927651.1 ATP-binding domain-containing protein [Mycolicibacterium smegmatis]UAK53516.1 ATP-binding domain-containing protein [Mycolicibacterium smegmatis]